MTTLDDIFPVLDSVRGDLSITGNLELETISGFNELDSVGGDININFNIKMKTFSGFGKLKKVGGRVALFGSNDVTTVSGFSALTSIGKDVIIGLRFLANHSLTTLPPFSSLTRIGGTLKVEANPALATFSGFPVLKRIGGGIDVNNNPALATLSGFGALMSVGGNIMFFENQSLTALPSFSSLTKVGGKLSVTRNDMLASCCGIFPFVGGTLAPGGATTINRNAAGCNSVSAIKANCGSTRTLRALSTDLTATEAAGRVIFDVAANVPWAITNSDTWISSITPKTGSDNQTITIEYDTDENTDKMQRIGVLTLAANDVGATETLNINLTPSGCGACSIYAIRCKTTLCK